MKWVKNHEVLSSNHNIDITLRGVIPTSNHKKGGEIRDKKVKIDMERGNGQQSKGILNVMTSIYNPMRST